MRALAFGSPSAIAASMALHVGALIVASRHVFPPSRASEPTVLVSVDTEPDPAPEVPREAPLSNHVAATAPELRRPALDLPHPRRGIPPENVAAVTPVLAEASPSVLAAAASPGDEALPRFALGAGGRRDDGTLLTDTAAGKSLSGREADEEGPYAEAAVDVPARALREVRPRYPHEAQARGIEGTVRLEIVLSREGVVSDVRAVTREGHGFEAAAIDAVRRTPFAPARRHGRPVPVRMAWTVEFQIQ